MAITAVMTDVPQVDAQQYAEQGFLFVPGVFDADTMAAARNEADAMLQRVVSAGVNVEGTWKGQWREKMNVGESTTDADVAAMAASVSSIHNVQYHSAFFTRLILDERFTGVVAQLIGPDVQLHHTKYHVKPPAIGAPFPMHQDYPYFPHELHTMLVAAIHFDASTVENGCLCVMPGSNKRGPLAHVSGQGTNHYLPLEEWPLEKATACEAQPGDVLIMNYLTVHGSYVNHSARPRRVLLVQLRSPLDRPTAQVHLSPGQGTMLRGINPIGKIG